MLYVKIHSDLLGLSWNPLDMDHTFYLMGFFLEDGNNNGKQKHNMYI